MGYAGGHTDSPTYRSIGDHTETVQLDFDPTKISYRQLLNIFWHSHSYDQKTSMTQYKNAIFYHNAEQHQEAMASQGALEQKTGKTVQTDILPLNAFTLAEDYHQKYLLKGSPLKHLLDKYYTSHDDLVKSTAAARLNGYAGKNGTKKQLLNELHSLGVNEHGKKLLMTLVRD